MSHENISSPSHEYAKATGFIGSSTSLTPIKLRQYFVARELELLRTISRTPPTNPAEHSKIKELTKRLGTKSCHTSTLG